MHARLLLSGKTETNKVDVKCSGRTTPAHSVGTPKVENKTLNRDENRDMKSKGKVTYNAKSAFPAAKSTIDNREGSDLPMITRYEQRKLATTNQGDE